MLQVSAPRFTSSSDPASAEICWIAQKSFTVLDVRDAAVLRHSPAVGRHVPCYQKLS